MEHRNLSRREMVCRVGGAGLGLAGLLGCEDRGPAAGAGGEGAQTKADYSHEEYVWISAHVNLPLYVAHDHQALFQIGKELGVKVTVAGPDMVDIGGLISSVEQTIVRKPAGIMVVGFDPSALISPINRAIDKGIPVVCVDADVPKSKRMAFVGTDWYDLGVRQGQAMVNGLKGRKGKVAMLGLISQYIDQEAFRGFRSVVEPEGFDVMDPLEDKGNVAEAARVASALIQSASDLVGLAGFDSESGPGIGMAVQEAGKGGQLVCTAVDAEEHHLRFVKQGILTAAIGQKRELFTYYGVKALFEINHTPLHFTTNDREAGIYPVPEIFYTGSYTVTKENVDLFLKS